VTLPRFFVDPQTISQGQARLSGPERDHLVRVLRLGAGDRVILFDGVGREYPACVRETARRHVLLEVEAARPGAAEPIEARVVLLQGLPRLARIDWLVEKATEAGVAALVPVLARRSPPEARRAGARLERWRKIAREACRQCGRARVPEIHSPLIPSAAWSLWAAKGRCAILHPRASTGLREWLGKAASREWVVAVGPEGGWDERELEQAHASGFEAVGAGPRTLRAETAGVLAVAAVQLMRGDLGRCSVTAEER
jgi:16S rRNA (uracil1498-N3)-methyltransferase